MFPCEMARYIAGFPQEARKSGPRRWSFSRSDPGLRSDRSRFSISEHSAGISSLLPVPRVAAAEPDAVAAGRGPRGGVAAPALLSAAGDVAAAVGEPGVGVRRVGLAAWALQAPPWV